MLFGIKEPLQQGAKLPLSLTFDKAGIVAVEASIEPVGSPGPGAKPAKP